ERRQRPWRNFLRYGYGRNQASRSAGDTVRWAWIRRRWRQAAGASRRASQTAERNFGDRSVPRRRAAPVNETIPGRRLKKPTLASFLIIIRMRFLKMCRWIGVQDQPQ